MDVGQYSYQMKLFQWNVVYFIVVYIKKNNHLQS